MTHGWVELNHDEMLYFHHGVCTGLRISKKTASILRQIDVMLDYIKYMTQAVNARLS
jgi:hypothetical protein